MRKKSPLRKLAAFISAELDVDVIPYAAALMRAHRSPLITSHDAAVLVACALGRPDPQKIPEFIAALDNASVMSLTRRQAHGDHCAEVPIEAADWTERYPTPMDVLNTALAPEACGSMLDIVGIEEGGGSADIRFSDHEQRAQFRAVYAGALKLGVRRVGYVGGPEIYAIAQFFAAPDEQKRFAASPRRGSALVH